LETYGPIIYFVCGLFAALLGVLIMSFDLGGEQEVEEAKAADKDIAEDEGTHMSFILTGDASISIYPETGEENAARFIYTITKRDGELASEVNRLKNFGAAAGDYEVLVEVSARLVKKDDAPPS
jgi:hypothetical protein